MRCVEVFCKMQKGKGLTSLEHQMPGDACKGHSTGMSFLDHCSLHSVGVSKHNVNF